MRKKETNARPGSTKAGKNMIPEMSLTARRLKEVRVDAPMSKNQRRSDTNAGGGSGTAIIESSPVWDVF